MFSTSDCFGVVGRLLVSSFLETDWHRDYLVEQSNDRNNANSISREMIPCTYVVSN